MSLGGEKFYGKYILVLVLSVSLRDSVCSSNLG